MDKTLQLLSHLRHVRVDWARASQPWSDFRKLIPLALIGHFSLDPHIAALVEYHGATHLPDCFKVGVQDWFCERNVEECLKDPLEWSRWVGEYEQCLGVAPEHFSPTSPSEVAAEVLDAFYYLHHANGRTFFMHQAQRLQVALLHIQYLPPNSTFYGKELEAWATAKPEEREKASPTIAQWYNLVQDASMLRWHLLNPSSIDATSQALPSNILGEAEVQP